MVKWWCFIAVPICWITIVEGVSLTYVLKRDGEKLHPSCLAEGLERYQALGWIYPMPVSDGAVPNTTTRYIPSLQNEYDCQFGKNDKCNTRWSGRDWQIDETSSRTREFIDDIRWEDLPTTFISKSTPEFSKRFHLESSNKASFSVRAVGAVELFLCTGWNPRNYPCYYFRIEGQEIFFKKLTTLPETIDFNNTHLEYSKAATNVIAEDEWRSFEVTVDNGTVSFVDKNNHRLLISYEDSEPISSLYLLMRSSVPSLWKVIENHFMYTETAQISRLGPQIEANYKDLCISLLVASCDNCQMSFFYMNGSDRHILRVIPPTENKWIEVKLKQENIKWERFNLFIQTEFLNKSESSAGWWAYDNVRVCNENEVKVAYLKLNQKFARDDSTVSSISCQLINNPKFRTPAQEYDRIEDNVFAEFPPIEYTVNDTAITLKWAEEDPDHYLTYFVYYQGNDYCSTEDVSSKRLMSGGFLTTKHNEITIEKLVPFTTYNVTLSSVLHENDKFLRINTAETDEPTIDELPISMHIRPLDTAVNISWEKPICDKRHGRLIYNVIVANSKLNFTKTLEGQEATSYLINGLQPFTKYTVTVLTARNMRNLMREVNTQNVTYQFKTLAGVAGTVENLEVYAVGSTKAFLRYDLPSNSVGLPTEIELTRCNVLSVWKCKSFISRISRCSLWPKKMCVDVDYLMPGQNYSLKLAVKNANTNAFGKQTGVVVLADERVPAPPENVTYQVVDCQDSTDYCHLNISWLHPYFPNGTINSFNIILNSTYFNTSDQEEDQTMHEVYKIINETYLPQYIYQVTYVPYSREYTLYIQSANSKYKSGYTTTTVKTADLGDHIDQRPKLLGNGDKAVVFKLPTLDRRLDSYTLAIGVQDYNESIPLHTDSVKNKKLADNICHPYGMIWLAQELIVKDNQTKTVTISGLDDKRSIKPNTKYCIIFVITNKYKGEDHDVVYYEKMTTTKSQEPTKETNASSFNHLWMLLLLLLLVPLGFGIFWCVKKRRSRRPRRSTPEHHYESVPFKEHEKNYVNNRTYDHLIHK